MSLFLKLALPALLVLHSLATPVLRKPKQLQPDGAQDTVALGRTKLERLHLDLPAANTSYASQRVVDVTQRVAEGSLPVYVPSDSEGKPLVQEEFVYNFSSKEVNALNYSKSHGLAEEGAHCTTLNTIFDMGFYDGADARAYLGGGYCVVGVEADPDLVALALQNFAVFVATGQLQMANAAIAPQGEASAWTVFYRNKCSKEWNSFVKTVGCRACAPPHAVDMNACEPVQVTSTDCTGIFGTFGVPHYLKLDIEGAETGCFQAMQKFPVGTQLPQYSSAEITQLDYIDSLHQLGYKGFKLVRQDRLASASGSTSGPWGENALDCRTGPWWRDYAQIRAEFAAILSKDLVATDPCPGGVMPIHGSPKMAAAYMWYDLHASLTIPAAR